jgi:four helix bundle protein
MKLNKYRELIVWQKSIEFAEKIYLVTKHFPMEERFGLAAQLKRSAVSIPSNIAEGAGRESKREFSQFLSISMGSCFEAETQLILANKIGMISNEELNNLLHASDEIQKILVGLKKSLVSKINSSITNSRIH